MKNLKFFAILSLLLTVTLTVSAQLIVYDDGSVSIKRDSSSMGAMLSIGKSSYNNYQDYMFGLISQTDGTAIKPYNIGVSGKAQVVNRTVNIGVQGLAYGTSSRNYGVLGGLSGSTSAYGAGVFGTTVNHLGFNMTGRYAAYFDGATYVNGTVTATSMVSPADMRLNENVVSLNERGETNTLDNLLAMNVIEYNMKRKLTDEMPDGVKQEDTEELREAYEYLKKEDMEMSSRRHFGIDAEGLQKVYPDLVLEGQDGYLAVKYVELVPVLIRAIQELKEELDAVKGYDAERKAPSATGISAVKTNGNTLYQNTPNPFKEQTVIRFSLADNVQDASISIFDMTGKTIKKLPISSGMDCVSVGGYELGDGMFLYSLIVNGQVIDTKRMVISK